MLDLPGHPLLDKDALIGGSARLPLKVDAIRLRAEVDALPAEWWGTTSGRVGVHRTTEAIFLRGYAPAEGDKPIEDRPALSHVPYINEIIYTAIPATPLRCLLARMPGGGVIAPHVDQAPYFAKSIRIHIPINTHVRVWMICGALSYSMGEGEVWALNNCTRHAVWNADPARTRTHLICDFLPSAELLKLLAAADRSLGRENPEINAFFQQKLN